MTYTPKASASIEFSREATVRMNAAAKAFLEKAQVEAFNTEHKLRFERRRRISAESKAIIEAEVANGETLRGIGPDEWLRRVITLPAEIRREAACVIWWDFFSSRLSGERWTHLDKYVNRIVRDVSESDLAKALIDCGYTPYAASARLRGWRHLFNEAEEAAA